MGINGINRAARNMLGGGAFHGRIRNAEPQSWSGARKGNPKLAVSRWTVTSVRIWPTRRSKTSVAHLREHSADSCGSRTTDFSLPSRRTSINVQGALLKQRCCLWQAVVIMCAIYKLGLETQGAGEVSSESKLPSIQVTATGGSDPWT